MLCVQQLSLLLGSVVRKFMPLYIHTYIGSTLFILNTHFADNGKYASKLQTYDVIVDGLHTVGAIRCHVMYFGRRTN